MNFLFFLHFCPLMYFGTPTVPLCSGTWFALLSCVSTKSRNKTIQQRSRHVSHRTWKCLTALPSSLVSRPNAISLKSNNHPACLYHHQLSTTILISTIMTPSKTNRNAELSNAQVGKATATKLPPSRPVSPKYLLPTADFSSSPSPKPARLVSPAPPKSSHPAAIQPQKVYITPKPCSPQTTQPQRIQPHRPSATLKPSPHNASTAPKPSHLTPPEHKPSINAITPRKISATPKLPSPANPTPRKHSATSKLPSPPKPDWKAPPGKACPFTPSPTHIPLPSFSSSARQEVMASPRFGSLVGSSTGGVCTPVAGPKRRRSTAKGSSPLVCEVNEEDIAGTSGKEETKQEVKELGLSFKDPFSSILGSGFEPGVSSGIPVCGSEISRVRSIADVCSPTSPISPRPRIYTPTSTATTPTFTTAFATIIKNSEHQQQAQGTGEETPKRDSLSPMLSPTSATPSPKPTFSSPATPKNHVSKIPRLRYRHLGTPSTLPLTLSSMHPYTGNTHITPSCTVGSLTHRLSCGHLVVTVVPEVCGTNCTYPQDVQKSDKQGNGGKVRNMSGQMGNAKEKQASGWEKVWREKIERKREQAESGFVANIRDLDAEWECPCCGNGKGRRYVAVLAAGYQ